MLEVRWEILEEEGRTLKAACDLAKVPCIFICKNSLKIVQTQSSRNNQIVSTIKDMQNLSQSYPQLSKLFGSTQQQKQMVRQILEAYEKDLQGLKMPILQFYQQHDFPFPQKVAKEKLSNLLQALTKLQKIVANRKGKFICGNQLTIPDILFYFHVCNLTYFRKNQSQYPQIAQWFGQLYQIHQIRSTTHQWFSMAKQIIRSMRKKRERSRL